MKICDVTQFYSPFSGGVKRYVHEKIRYIQALAPGDEHALIVPGETTGCTESERSRVYSIHSPLISRTSRYRLLLNMRALGEIVEREQPDIIESGDPYQVGWKTISLARALDIPAVAFYHSHFPEAHLRGAARFLGRRGAETLMKSAQRYVRNFYNKFAATLVPSADLAAVLQNWGVTNVRPVKLGVDTEVFRPAPDDSTATRDELGIAPSSQALLYVGRLAPEKNVATLFRSMALLHDRSRDRCHLVVVGDGPQRNLLGELRSAGVPLTHIPYLSDPTQLARLYRAADLFVHPGTQETFGLVSLESQACGTPVVGIRGSYMDRVVFHGQEFWAIENTPHALAAAIEKALQADLPALGTIAARIAQREYAWPRVFEELFCIYHEVCAAYRESRRA